VPDTSTAVAREAAWLAQTGVGGLPSLLETAGGPFETVQAYYGRSPNMRKRSIYVMRQSLTEMRLGGLRKIDRYSFRLIVRWPSKSTTGRMETDEADFDAAIDKLLQRIRGPVGDHTHGGAFLSVAEEANGATISVDFDPPERTLAGSVGNSPYLSATVRYSADDEQINS
jgi:hypothetical protein